MTTKHPILTSISALAFAAASHASTVLLFDASIDYNSGISGGNPVAGPINNFQVDFDNDGFTDDAVRYLPFPTNFSWTTAPSIDPAIRGGFAAIDYNYAGSPPHSNGSIALAMRRNDTNTYNSVNYTDPLRFQWTGNNGTFSTDRVVAAVLMSPATPISAANLTSLNVVARLVTGASTNFRWIIESGGNTYVSQATFAPTGTFTEFNLSTPAGANWSVWDFNGPSNTDFTQLVFGGTSFSSVSLGPITGIGLYFDTAVSTTVDVIQFGYTAVPEPSSIAALLGAAALIVTLRRRR